MVGEVSVLLYTNLKMPDYSLQSLEVGAIQFWSKAKVADLLVKGNSSLKSLMHICFGTGLPLLQRVCICVCVKIMACGPRKEV